MKRAVSRLLTAVLVTGSVGVALVPVASAADTVKVTPTLEGWYQPNPSCAQQTGCVTTDSLPVTPPVPLPDVPASPYPAGTMHVAWASQSETARAYLAFPFEGLTGTLTGAELDVPLDTAPADGDAQSATAKVQVCLVTGTIIATEGSLSAPPSIDCSTHADATYVATPTPHLHADLAPLLVGLPTTSGIVLLPDAEKNIQSDAWHVVFSSHARTDDAKTDPATLSLTVTAQDVVSTPEAPAVELPGPAAPIDSGFAPGPGTGFAPPPAVEVPSVSGPAAPVVQPAQPQVVPTAQTVTVGYAYPVVWLLPLVFLVLVPLATRSLTKELA